jgi:glycosyltransferase involved in cell wall biosynthesis
MVINISLILPCYNEEKNIPLLYKEFLEIPLSDYKAELIFVNNGSKDNTKEEIEKVIKKNSHNNIQVNLVDLEKNAGYGGGISEGLNIAQGDYIGWSHADLQTPLKDFFTLFLKIKNKKDILGKGYRTNHRGFDGIVSRFHEYLTSLILGYKMKEINAQPKIFNKELIKNFSDMPHKSTVLDTYVMYKCLKKGVKIETIDVVFNNRRYGESKWKSNFINFISHIFFNLIYLFKLRFSKNNNDSIQK